MNESCHTYEWVMSHIWMSRVTHTNKAYRTYGWGTSQMWMKHVAHMDESRHAYEWVMTHIWRRHVTHMNDPCHTYEWVMSYIWMSHVTFGGGMSHVWMRHVTNIKESIMRWLRLVGSRKTYVSFAKEPYDRDDILQKRPIILRSLLLEATPYSISRLLKIIGLFCRI